MAELKWAAEVAHNDQPIQIHLIETHNMKREEVLKLNTAECWECHNQLHEKELGGDWVG